MRKPNSYFSLIAKIKIERPELLLTLPPTYVQKHLIFVFSPLPPKHTPLKVHVISVSSLADIQHT